MKRVRRVRYGTLPIIRVYQNNEIIWEIPVVKVVGAAKTYSDDVAIAYGELAVISDQAMVAMNGDTATGITEVHKDTLLYTYSYVDDGATCITDKARLFTYGMVEDVVLDGVACSYAVPIAEQCMAENIDEISVGAGVDLPSLPVYLIDIVEQYDKGFALDRDAIKASSSEVLCNYIIGFTVPAPSKPASSSYVINMLTKCNLVDVRYEEGGTNVNIFIVGSGNLRDVPTHPIGAFSNVPGIGATMAVEDVIIDMTNTHSILCEKASLGANKDGVKYVCFHGTNAIKTEACIDKSKRKYVSSRSTICTSGFDNALTWKYPILEDTTITIRQAYDTNIENHVLEVI